MKQENKRGQWHSTGATRWDKTQCGAAECSAVQSVQGVTSRGDAHNLDAQKTHKEESEKSRWAISAARVSKCKSAGTATYISKWGNVPPLHAEWLQLYRSKKKQAKQAGPSVQVKWWLTLLHRFWFGVTLFHEPQRRDSSPLVCMMAFRVFFPLKAYLHSHLQRYFLQANVTFWKSTSSVNGRVGSHLRVA